MIDTIRDMHEVCAMMGWQVISSDRFVRQALEYLCDCRREADGSVNIEEVGLSRLAGNDKDGWIVCGNDYSAGGDTLIEALFGAIHCVQERES